jgi:hypothetical protein
MGVSADIAGRPAETAPVPPDSPAAPEAAVPYTITGIVGLLHYLITLEAFFPASARRLFGEQNTERRIKDLADALSCLEEGPQAIPEPGPAGEAVPSAMPSAGPGPADETAPAAAPGPAGYQISVESLTGLLNHLGELARNLPQTGQRDILKQKVKNIIEGLNATI